MVLKGFAHSKNDNQGYNHDYVYQILKLWLLLEICLYDFICNCISIKVPLLLIYLVVIIVIIIIITTITIIIAILPLLLQ